MRENALNKWEPCLKLCFWLLDGENDDNTDDYLNGDNDGGGANNNGGRGRLLLRGNDLVVNGVMLQRGRGTKGRDSTLGNGELLGRRVGKAYLW